MLRQLRLFASSFVGGIVILLLALMFVPAGTQQTQGSTNLGSSVISIGGERFYDIDVQRAANTVLLQANNLVNGNPRSIEEARQLEGWQRVEDLVVGQVTRGPALLEELNRQGWTASEQEIIAQIPNDPTFQVAGQYVKLLAEQALDSAEREAQYVRQKQMEINGNRIQQFASRYSPSYVPTPVAQLAYDRETRLYGFDVINLNAGQEDVGEPSDEQLQELFDENRDNYRTQEYRGFSAIVVTPNDFFDASAGPSDEELLQAYLAAESDLTFEEFTAQNSDTSAQEAAAEQAAAVVNTLLDAQQNGVGPADSLDFVEATIQDLADVSGASVQTFEPLDRFARNEAEERQTAATQTPQLLADLFALNAVGDVSEIREISEGSAIVVQLDSIVESRNMTFEESKDRLTSLWRYNAQVDLLTERAQTGLEAIRSGEQTFSDFAAAENVELETLDLMDQEALAQNRIDPNLGTTMSIGDVELVEAGNRAVFYQLREIGQQEAEEIATTLDDISAGVQELYFSLLNNAFIQEIQASSDVTVNEREFAASLNSAILTANNAGYFDGTATQASVQAALARLQNAGGYGGGGHGGGGM